MSTHSLHDNMPKPKLMMDTNAAQKLTFDTRTYDIHRIQATLRKSYRIVVSPETLIEILNGVIGAKTDEHLAKDQRKLRTATGNETTPTVLRFPGDFALRTVLGIQSSLPAFNPNHFRLWIKAVLHAGSRYELEQRHVRIPNRRATYGLDPKAIAIQQNEGKANHREWLQLAIDGTKTFPDRDEWARRIGIGLEINLTPPQSQELGNRLSAAYAFQSHTFRTAMAGPSYNVTKHDGDWIDNQQLFYLCDSNLYVLTEEESIRDKCSTSKQSERILLLTEI